MQGAYVFQAYYFRLLAVVLVTTSLGAVTRLKLTLVVESAYYYEGGM
jgi:hypothetical protein